MLVGSVTLDGQQIGSVNQDEDIPNAFTPPLAPSSDGVSPMAMPRSAPIGRAYGGHSHYSDHHASTHHYAGGSGRSGSSGGSNEMGNIPYSSTGNPFDRARFAKELEEKPWLKEKIKHISLGENQDPRANTAVLETMMNRAVVRGTSLEKEARRHRSSGVDEGGYYAGYNPNPSPAKQDMFERNLGEVLGSSGKGQSNVSNYATDNSSGDLAAREMKTGSFVHHTTINGESFFSPGHAEPVLRDRWQSLHQRATNYEQSKAKDTAAATKPFDPETMAP